MFTRWAGLTRLQRLIRRSAAYADVFGARAEARSRSQHDVLADLAEFCGMHKPPLRGDSLGRGDPMKTAVAIGRQEVYLRIMEIARITPAQIHAYFEAEARGPAAEAAIDNEGEAT